MSGFTDLTDLAEHGQGVLGNINVTGAQDTKATNISVMADTPLRVISLNVLMDNLFESFSKDYGLEKELIATSHGWRRRNIISTMRKLNADVWCLQETTEESAAAFAEALGYQLVAASYKNKTLAAPSRKPGPNSGVCVLLRRSLEAKLLRRFQADRIDNKAPVAGLTLQLGGASPDLTVITTHLVMNYPNIDQGLNELHSTLEAQGVDYRSTVLIGDFNADTTQSSQDLDNFCTAHGVERLLVCFPRCPDQLMAGSAVPRLAIGVCSEVPTLAMHLAPRKGGGAKGENVFKMLSNQAMMKHRVIVSDHVPFGFTLPTKQTAK